MGEIWKKIRSWDPIAEWKSTDSNKRKVWIAVRVALMLAFGIALGLIVLAFKWLFIIAVSHSLQEVLAVIIEDNKVIVKN